MTSQISLTRTTIYDTEADFDTEADRVDHTGQEEVLAYVPAGSKYRQIVIDTLDTLAEEITDGADHPSSAPTLPKSA